MTENSEVGDSTSQEHSAPAEKLVPQSKVDEIARDAFNRGHQKGSSLGGMSPQSAPAAPAINHQDLNKVIGEIVDQKTSAYQKSLVDKAQREEGQRVLTELQSKIDAASSKHPDYEKVTGQHNWSQMPEVLHYANSVDNAGDVLYDLSNNPSKIATIRGLPPQSAVLEIKKLSNSIKQNEQAASDAQNPPPSPISQFKPSNLAGDKKPKTAAEHAAARKGRG